MDDIDATELEPLFEKLEQLTIRFYEEAHLEIVSCERVPMHFRANAAGFICAGMQLVRQGLNTAVMTGEPMIELDVDRVTVSKGQWRSFPTTKEGSQLRGMQSERARKQE